MTEISRLRTLQVGCRVKKLKICLEGICLIANHSIIFTVALATYLTIRTAVVLFGGQNNAECLELSYQTCKDNNNVDKNGTEC